MGKIIFTKRKQSWEDCKKDFISNLTYNSKLVKVPDLKMGYNFYDDVKVVSDFIEQLELSIVNLAERGKSVRVDFFDRFRQVVYDYYISDVFYVYTVRRSDNENLLLYSKDKLEVGKTYTIKGMCVDVMHSRKIQSATSHFIRKNIIACESNLKDHDFKNIENIKKLVNSFDDIAIQWNFELDRNMYPLIDNYLIFSNLVFVMRGIPGLNLVYGSSTRTAKTTLLKVLAKIFDEQLISLTEARSKGLTVSFFGEFPRLGALFNANSIFLGNEFWRFFITSGDPNSGFSTRLKNSLSEWMEYMEHAPVKIVSGKGDIIAEITYPVFFVDNFAYNEYVKKVWESDPALLSRYTFITMGKETENMIRDMMKYDNVTIVKNILDRMKISKADFYKLVYYLRYNQKNVKYDYNELRDRISKFYDIKDDKYGISEKSIGVITGIVLWNHVFENRKDFIANEKDYDIFEKCLERIVNDFNNMLKEDEGNLIDNNDAFVSSVKEDLI